MLQWSFKNNSSYSILVVQQCRKITLKGPPCPPSTSIREEFLTAVIELHQLDMQHWNTRFSTNHILTLQQRFENRAEGLKSSRTTINLD